MRPKAKRPTVPVQSLGLESRPGLDVPRRAVPERRVFESGNKAERSAPIGSNVDGAHPRGPRDPTPAGRGAPQKDPSDPSCILYYGPAGPAGLRAGPGTSEPQRAQERRAARAAARAVGVAVHGPGRSGDVRGVPVRNHLSNARSCDT